MSYHKIIHDPVHGSIKLDKLAVELLSTPKMQRLNHIKQLGLAHLVFPGANHTRLEHSLGVHYLARRAAHELGLDKDEANVLSSAALLHDVGHGPFSHSLEPWLVKHIGKDHEDIGSELITKGESIPSILESHGVDPQQVAALMSCKERKPTLYDFPQLEFKQEDSKPYLSSLIHGAMDLDQMDYLLRDSHYTGVAHGAIDVERLLLTLEIDDGQLCTHRKGLAAVEGALVARSLMYSAVYFHKTCRIAQIMLARAVENLDSPDHHKVQRYTDCELMEVLKKDEGSRDLADALLNRRLYKSTYHLDWNMLTKEKGERLKSLIPVDERRKWEKGACDAIGVKQGCLFMDIPLPELLLSEPRMSMTFPTIKTEKGKVYMSELSPLASALQKRHVPSYAVMVACPEEFREKAAQRMEGLLFN